ncbi:glycosyltransferase family 4 protein [Ferruginibacter albus]|uniref:glycosyltransferase family 4 protein n=1 Tax=Ferruginibacter albus TaxID=2875540 RepID=UPI001CC6F3AA|nr:glycosyltransferase family 4 protein [Ferruginibacter albus]UAY52230.1 glycosyltransferase family 4 protein [Ferruginibacter albus]
MKKTILHIIHNLERGGAETLLVAVVAELKDYRNIIVTFNNKNLFGDQLQCDEWVCLNISSHKQLPLAVLRLRKVIKKYQPDIVHSHLFWPTLAARLATPKKIPLITTIHAFIETFKDYRSEHVKQLDKITYRFRKSIIIAVANGALQEYFSFLKLKPYKTFVLYNFVDTNRFLETNSPSASYNKPFKIISVGALRAQKNHLYLLEAFKHLNKNDFELHIFGEGPTRLSLETFIKENELSNVRLKGNVTNIQDHLPHYDLCAMPSFFEGFSLSVLEAMAMNVPLLLSNIDSFKEQCEDCAVYFDLNNIQDFIDKLQQLAVDKEPALKMAANAKQRVLKNFTLEQHMDKLRDIYTIALQD